MNLIPNKESYFGRNVHRNRHRKDLELVLHQPHTLKRAIRKSWHPQSTPILGRPWAECKSTLQNGPLQGSSFPHEHQLYKYMTLHSSSFKTINNPSLFLTIGFEGITREIRRSFSWNIWHWLPFTIYFTHLLCSLDHLPVIYMDWPKLTYDRGRDHYASLEEFMTSVDL